MPTTKTRQPVAPVSPADSPADSQPVNPADNPADSQPVNPADSQPVNPDSQPVIDQQTAESLTGGLFAIINPGQPDPTDVFRSMFVRLASGTDDVTDQQTADLLSALRAVPSAIARERAQSGALADCLRARADYDRTTALSDALVAGQKTRTRSTSAPVDQSTAYVDRLAALAVAGLALPTDGTVPDDVLTGLVNLFGQSTADLLVNLLGSLSGQPVVPDASRSDRQTAVLARAARALSAVNHGQSGPRGPVAQRRADGVQSAGRMHVDQCIATVAVGTFLTTGAMAKMVSTAYPDTARRPSSGALANVVRTAKTGQPVVTDTWSGSANPDGATRTA